MPDKVEWLMASATANIVKIIMHEKGSSMPEAMNELFSSSLYDGLSDRETGLYLESPSYLYELLKLGG